VVEDVVGVRLDLEDRAQHPVEEQQAGWRDHGDEHDVADPPEGH